MDYLDYSKTLFDKIDKTDFSKLTETTQHPLRALIPYVLENFSYDKFTVLYKKETDRIIEEFLPISKDDEDQRKKLKSIDYYNNSVNTYSWMFLFWIWQNNISISNKELEILLEAEFMGMMGYRLIDIYTDDEGNNKDYLFLGNYLIRLFEQRFNDIFDSKETFDLLNYYGMKYNEIEYLEKRNLWKSSPFSITEISYLGYKTSPLISLFHTVFSKNNVPEQKSNDLLNAFLNALAANQIVDDLSDAASDLSVGRETPVMQGFYNKFGINETWTEENINNFLSGARITEIYKTIVRLFDDAIDLASKHNDTVFLLFIELGRYVYLKNFEIKPIE